MSNSINKRPLQFTRPDASPLKIRRSTAILLRRKIAVSTQEGMHFIDPMTIVRCEADNNYCMILLRSGKSILVSKTLKVIEAALPVSRFVRVHNSHVVAIQEITFVGKYHLRLTDATKVPVSRRSRHAVLELMLDESVVI